MRTSVQGHLEGNLHVDLDVEVEENMDLAVEVKDLAELLILGAETEKQGKKNLVAEDVKREKVTHLVELDGEKRQKLKQAEEHLQVMGEGKRKQLEEQQVEFLLYKMKTEIRDEKKCHWQ